MRVRLLCAALISVLFINVIAAQDASTAPSVAGSNFSNAVSPAGQNSAASPRTIPQRDYELIAPYWTAEGGWHTDLQLRNNLANENLTVTPALRTPDGTEIPLKPVTILPGEVQSINLSDALGATDPALLGQANAYGSVVMRYHSYSLRNLYGSVMVHDTGHPIMYHIDAFGEAPGYVSGSREGIWWLPTSSTRDYLILTNQSNHALQGTLRLYDASGKSWNEPVQLSPRQTERLSVRDLLTKAGLQGIYGGIKVEVPNGAGSLDTAHILFDEMAGFSATMKMFDYNPQMQIAERDFAQTGTWTTRAPMLALSNPDPVLAFPKDTVLHPLLLIRNTTARQAKANVRFHWRGPSGDGRASIPQLVLAPFETYLIDVKDLQDRGTLPKDAYWAQVTLSTNTRPDEVMAIAASYDSTLRYGAQTPFSDQMIAHLEGGQWQADATHTSLIAAGNGGNKPVKAALTFFYDQGRKQYRIEQVIAPDDQLWINVNDLIHNQVPDKDGNIIPADVTSGAYQLREVSQPEQNFLYEGKVITDKTYGHATYGCMLCCGYTSPYFFIADPVFLPVAGDQSVTVNGTDACTNGTSQLGGYFPSWISSNTAILTVTPNMTHGVSAGTSPYHATATQVPSGEGQDQRLCPVRGALANGTGNVLNLTPVQHNYPGNPLPNACWISQVFDHIGANGKAHHAEDVTSSTGNGTHSSPPYGTSIYAMEGGKVTKLDGSQGPASPPFPACQGLNKLANTVWIQGNDGYITRYVHVTPTPGLTIGQNVTQGQLIGTLDNSGCQSGAHLHVGRYPPTGSAVNFTIPCVNQTPVTQLWDGSVDDDDTAITP